MAAEEIAQVTVRHNAELDMWEIEWPSGVKTHYRTDQDYNITDLGITLPDVVRVAQVTLTEAETRALAAGEPVDLSEKVAGYISDWDTIEIEIPPVEG